MSNYDDEYEAINYDAMPAGPEMDDLVAGIMEFTRKPWGTVLVWEGDGKAWAEWNPSVNIAHAWMVVEKMNGDIRTRLTNLFRSQEEERGYFANFGGSHMNTQGDTAPLAICRAALKAKAWA